MKPRSGKNKSVRLQNWTAHRISNTTNYPWGKDKPIEPRPMGQTGIDIRLEKEVLKLFPFSTECKNQQSWSIHKWIEQAKGNCIPNTDWIIVAKRNYSDPVVIIDAMVFFNLVRRSNKKKKRKRIKL